MPLKSTVSAGSDEEAAARPPGLCPAPHSSGYSALISGLSKHCLSPPRGPGFLVSLKFAPRLSDAPCPGPAPTPDGHSDSDEEVAYVRLVARGGHVPTAVGSFYLLSGDCPPHPPAAEDGRGLGCSPARVSPTCCPSCRPRGHVREDQALPRSLAEGEVGVPGSDMGTPAGHGDAPGHSHTPSSAPSPPSTLARSPLASLCRPGWFSREPRSGLPGGETVSRGRPSGVTS